MAYPSYDDFKNYENIINFKYKMINPKMQVSKMLDFLTLYLNELDYDWYCKTRPDIKLLENINFDILDTNAVNARTIEYQGPKKIKYGSSLNGEGNHKYTTNYNKYQENETSIILDDQFYIFHHNINLSKLNSESYKKCPSKCHRQAEWFFTDLLKLLNINLNPIGIYLDFTKYGEQKSGNLNC